ncbi:MAG: right-handed parallel beta-helix repeat-containing protein, partial [Ignavibacteriaceae bacterium]|nr:right-handed parallel beta-helix repeat-containing protein [Ignavibacteriaceae bacterium]
MIEVKGYKWRAEFNSLSYLEDKQLAQLCSEYSDLDLVNLNQLIQDSMYAIYKGASKSILSILNIPDWKALMIQPEYQNCGNCWAHACTGVVEGLLHKYLGYNNDLNLNEDFLTANGCNGCDGGGASCGFALIKNKGIPSKIGINSGWYYDNARYKVASYIVQAPTDISSIKNALMNSPVYATMNVYRDFYYFGNDPNYIYRHVYGEYIGNHAVVIIGYNDEEEYWLCKNSWGLSWGNQGYFKIAYGECVIDYLNCGTATVNQSSLAKIVPIVIPDLSTALNFPFGSGEYAYVLGYNSLNSQTNPIPYNGALLVKNGATINLNNFQLSVSGNIYNEWGQIIIEEGGNIQHSAKLKKNNLSLVIGYFPFSFINDYTISTDYELQFVPGVTAKFNSGKKLIVLGKLTAIGTSIYKITFDKQASSGNWSGLQFEANSTGTIEYCNIKNSTTGITCYSTLPNIRYNTISNNLTGISVSNIGTPSTEISFNTIQNDSSKGINLYYASPKIYSNTIANNASCGIYCYYSNPYLYGNTIYGHASGLTCISYSSAFLVPWNAYG